MNVNKLETIIADQKTSFQKRSPGVKREIEFNKHLKTKQITVISGIRRAGKSTLLRQFSEHYSDFYYINFDDERLIDFNLEDFNDLMLAFQKQTQADVILLDEIQNVDNWERFVRRIFEEGYKIFLTGSNANLLNSELAAKLTGRYFKIELFPFSFKEFLNMRNVDPEAKDTAGRAKLLKLCREYLQDGGFPEFLDYGDPEFVTRTYEDILYRDIIAKYSIREIKAFKELVFYLFSNFTNETSYNSLKNTLGFKSVTSVKNYIEYLKESYLIFPIYKYDYSLKKQYTSDKKIYVIDNGMRNRISFSFSEDEGRSMENVVFLELARRGEEIYFFKGNKECDFLIKRKNKITDCIQVSRNLDENNREREITGLAEAMETFNLGKGIIISEEEEGIKNVNGKKIEFIPLYKWLLS
ncbi:MAG: ATP-binding protein [Patescibacteria group bacterium]